MSVYFRDIHTITHIQLIYQLILNLKYNRKAIKANSFDNV